VWRRKKMLSIENLHVYYGGIHALKGISLQVDEGQIVTLIGANGAGKSTTLRTISGIVRPREGHIAFEGTDITELPAYEIVEQGIAMVPEGRRVFPELTVTENLLLGAHTRRDSAGVQEDLEWLCQLFPILEERASQSAGTLSGGEQQMLAVGRALMSRPRLLLMDEPSLGLAPTLVKEVFKTIRQLHDEGTTILLVEQNARAALRIADYGYILETGEIVLEGSGQALVHNDDVRKAYLGVD
jgi:branched-chain amino acid transport system ATP-binding protein